MTSSAAFENQVSLMQLVCAFMEHATAQGVKSFPHFSDIRWHSLLYILTELPNDSRALFCEIIGEFDWDGPHPKSREFNAIIWGLLHEYHSISPKFTRVVPVADLQTRTPNNTAELPHLKDAVLIMCGVADSIPLFLE